MSQPSWETLPHERLSPGTDTVGARMLLLRRLTGKRVHKRDFTGLGSFPRLQLLRAWATYRIFLSLFALVWLLRCAWLGATDHPRVSRDSLALDVFMVRGPRCGRIYGSVKGWR